MRYFRLLLWPLSLLYGGVMQLRNMLYDRGVLDSKRYAIPVIAVGNLTVGGTGKTPHVEYLLRLLQTRQVAVLSRGYKRKSKGFVLADHKASAASLGDEPFQYHRDFPGVTVAVSESRVEGIDKLQRLRPDLDAVVLDDAMQHRPVQPSLMIMLTDFNRPFYKDHVLPAGLLREPRSGAKRADIIMVSKCPSNLSAKNRSDIEGRIRRYSQPGIPVFFTGFRYGRPVAIGNAGQISNKIILLTGIANDRPLVNYLEEQRYTIVKHLSFADHYAYTSEDLNRIQQLLQAEQKGNVSIVTTRKDAVKLTDSSLREIALRLPLFYIPIEVEFMDGEADFKSLIEQHLASFDSNNTADH
ncbi:tetraacyldisaccharide 4'-kinase [Pontibacter sp. JH31]|uniref:Tetraacyldisaccharide 4'-kinase n=1 Tax=Pontibacter aquaedesilientis TaxID=2766980 RepID=A0ABR7XD97_9BACT|nr:tetraacyldisaccharide 4'-kinase [Pontibacter aquaedesilientis]MBD1396255.1 tetraacyldisaccharide 4'-kinase [Pontibacter aquaedesilientis]